MDKDAHLIGETYKNIVNNAKVCNEVNLGSVGQTLNQMMSNTGNIANNLLNNPNLVPALQAIMQQRGNQQTNQVSSSINKPELFRQYATALSGPELADPNKPENSLNLPHNKAMMELFEYAQAVGIQPVQLAQIVRPNMNQAMQQGGFVQQFQGQSKEQIMQQVQEDPRFLKTLQNVFQNTLQSLQQQYGRPQAQNQQQQQYQPQQYQPYTQNVYNQQSWTHGLAELMKNAYPNGIPTR